MRYYLAYIKFVLFFPLILILLLVRIFYKFKISKLQTNVFGLMLTPVELYICEKKNKSLEYNLIWFRDKNISNHYIYNHWKKKLIILPRHFLEPIYLIFSHFKIFNFIIHCHLMRTRDSKKIIYNNETDTKNLFQKYPPSIQFKSYEIQKAKVFFNEKQINENQIIVFCSRSKFPRNAIGKEENFETARNSNIQKYLKGLKYLSNKNFTLLRIGKNEKNKIETDDKRIIDFALSKDRNDFLETYLVAKSKFMICSNYGANELSVIFRKKRLIIDFFDFPSIEAQNLFNTPMIVPKTFYNLKDKIEINFLEAFKKKLYHIQKIDDLNRLGYGLKDNSEDQVEQAIINFNKLLNSELTIDDIYQEQINFWEQIKSFFDYNNKYKTIICPSFFNKNKDIFKI